MDMAVKMDKRILELIANFSQWKGDSYRLAMLIVDVQRSIDKDALIAAGFADAAEVI